MTRGINRRSFLRTSAAAAVAPAFARLVHAAPPAAAPAPGSENEKVTADFNAGLEVLKPSKKDLDHGLELHRSSIVLDTYGFGPGAAIDNGELARVINSGASAQEITDAREDMMMTRAITDKAEYAEFLAAWNASGVTAIIRNAGEEGNDPLRLMKRLARWIAVTDHLKKQFPKAVKADEIAAAKKAGHHAVMLTTNGVPLVQQWANIEDELRYVRVFAELGVRMMHVTYNRRNPLGDGCGEPNDAGLSDFGHHAVAELNRQNVIVDVAHSSQKTSLQAAKASKKPMVASHTVAMAVHEHIRAKGDDVIKAICDTGGLVGICLINGFLGGKNDLNSFLDHIDYVARKFGVDHVAIGTDTGYTSRLKPSDAKVPSTGHQRNRWESLWPEGSLRAGTRAPIAAASLAWTNWPLYTVGLVQRGYSDSDIQKILAGNMLRVLKANEA
jgi:membrane dipeptidase